MESAPTAMVSGVQHDGRSAVMSDVAHAMKADAEKSISDNGTPSSPPTNTGHIDDKWRYGNLNAPTTTKYVQNGKVNGHAIESDEAQRIVKQINAAADVKINRLTEIASYMRWGVLGMMATAFAGFGAYAGIIAAAAPVGLPVALGFGVGALILGVAQIAVSEQAKRLQANRWMDVQEYLQDRTATKIGKAVAVEHEKQPEQGKSWQDVVRISQEQAADINQGRA